MVSIGDLKYGEEKTFVVEVSNSGPVEGMWHFIPPPSLDYEGDATEPGLPAWVKAWPDEGIVPAGEPDFAIGSVMSDHTVIMSGHTLIISDHAGWQTYVLSSCDRWICSD